MAFSLGPFIAQSTFLLWKINFGSKNRDPWKNWNPVSAPYFKSSPINFQMEYCIHGAPKMAIFLILFELYKTTHIFWESYYLDYILVYYIRQPIINYSFQCKVVIFLVCSGCLAYFYESIVSSYFLSLHSLEKQPCG